MLLPCAKEKGPSARGLFFISRRCSGRLPGCCAGSLSGSSGMESPLSGVAGSSDESLSAGGVSSLMSSPLGSVGCCGLSSGKSASMSPVLSPLAELSASTGSPLSTTAAFPVASSANAGSAEPTQVNSISIARSSVAPRRQRWLLLILFKTMAPFLVHPVRTRDVPNRALFVNDTRIHCRMPCGYFFPCKRQAKSRVPIFSPIQNTPQQAHSLLRGVLLLASGQMSLTDVSFSTGLCVFAAAQDLQATIAAAASTPREAESPVRGRMLLRMPLPVRSAAEPLLSL